MHAVAAIAQRVDSCAISPLQHGMLVHYLAHGPHTGADVQQLETQLPGSVDPARLAAAWQLIAARHPVLRSCFDWEGPGAPRLHIMSAVDVPLVRYDLSACLPAERSAVFDRFLARDRRRGFDLGIAPLWRTALVDHGDGRHRMVWTYAHAILDDSHAEVIAELFEAYDALGRGATPRFRERPAYQDYMAFVERDWSARADAARAFWRHRLSGLVRPTTLEGLAVQADLDRASTAGTAPLRFRVSRTTTGRLRRLSETHHVRMSTVVRAAWAMVLSAFTGEEDVVFGEVKACRSSPPEAEAVIGLLINTVPVRARVPGDALLRDLLRDLDEGETALEPFERTPLIEAAACTDLPRDIGLFDTAIGFGWGKHADRDPRHALGAPESVLHEQASFAFMLRVALEPSLAFTLSFDRGRFELETARRLAMLFKRVLGEMARRPDTIVGDLPTLPAPDERALGVFSGRARATPVTMCVHELIEAQVDRTPAAVAVTRGRASLTFRELDERANRVAHDLVARGVGPDRTVGVFVDRSLEMIVGLLGILKAGGAYVPLDPAYQSERLAMMLEDTRPEVVLTTARMRAQLPPVAAHLTLLETFGGECRSDRPQKGVRPDHLAYVIFTSGSTGRPKGVQVEHRHVVSCFGGIDDVLGTEPGVWLALAGISFDISVLELFWTLARGFSVVLPERSQPPPLAGAHPGLGTVMEFSLRDEVRRHAVTHLQCTPSLLEQLASQEGGQEALGLLRHLLVGGEALPPLLVDQVGPSLTRTFHNMYGPTETTIWSTSAVALPGEPITIGRPLHGATIHIRDRHGRPAPIGVAGELIIGGAAVARGYIGRPELTAQRFVCDAQTGERMYRTGDLAAWRRDGQLVFLGRIDTQVKIRGHRVEPGEIDSVIGAHPSVRECVTVAQRGATGEVRLVAFVVSREIESLTPGGEDGAIGDSAGQTGGDLTVVLRQYAQARLPPYMVPRAVVLLDAMPLTPNGKVDRQALARPTGAVPKDRGRPPQNAVERAIVGILETLVGRPVGVDDNFLDAGVHSLLMIQASRRLESGLDRRITVADLFHHPTARSLAAALKTAEAEELAVQQAVDRGRHRRAALRRRLVGREA